MSVSSRPGVAPAPPARILVVDDDRRVVELLQIALAAHGFVVLTASDGDEAIKRALSDRPDLVVLDVRLPRKGGLEVCDFLRNDPDDSQLPIILVSAAADTEARLVGLGRGADDYLTKPFSPKELIARIKRLLSRSGDAREARRRARDLERELTRAQDEIKRAHLETRAQQRMRELAFGLGRDLLEILDEDELARRLLLAVQTQIRAGTVALLARHGGGSLVPLAVRGDEFERVASLELPTGGELAGLLHGLGRPVLRQELERFPELRGELPPLVAARFALLAPLRGPAGLEGLLLADERPDGLAFLPGDLEALAGLCQIAAVALHNGQRFRAQLDRMLELLAPRAARDGISEARAEAGLLAERAGRALAISPRELGLLRHAAALGPWLEGVEGMRALAGLEDRDPTGRIRDLRDLLASAAESDRQADRLSPERRRAALLLAIARRYAAERASGGGAWESMVVAVEACGATLDSSTRDAIEGALREALSESAA